MKTIMSEPTLPQRMMLWMLWKMVMETILDINEVESCLSTFSISLCLTPPT